MLCSHEFVGTRLCGTMAVRRRSVAHVPHLPAASVCPYLVVTFRRTVESGASRGQCTRLRSSHHLVAPISVFRFSGPVAPARPLSRSLHLCSRTASVCARVHSYVKACRSRGYFPCGTRTSLRPTSSEDVTPWMFSSPVRAHRHETQ